MSAETPGTLRGDLVILRPLTTADAGRLVKILDDPAVSRWWGRHDLDRVRRELIERDDGAVGYVIVVGGVVIGFVQYGEEDEPDYRHASIDIFLDPAWHGRGLGADAVRTVARHLFADRGHHRITIDPAAHNERAIRSYRRVGFRPVGTMRRYERGPEGEWHDGLLMDLLRNEIT